MKCRRFELVFFSLIFNETLLNNSNFNVQAQIYQAQNKGYNEKSDNSNQSPHFLIRCDVWSQKPANSHVTVEFHTILETVVSHQFVQGHNVKRPWVGAS